VQSSSFACDGCNLYVWDEVTGSLRKFGTGLDGTIGGEEISSNNDIRDQIRTMLGLSVDDGCAGQETSISDFSNANLTGYSSLPSFIPTDGVLTLEDMRVVHTFDGGATYRIVHVSASIGADVTRTGNYFEVEILSLDGDVTIGLTESSRVSLSDGGLEELDFESFYGFANEGQCHGKDCIQGSKR
jgi:hypothetical protein